MTEQLFIVDASVAIACAIGSVLLLVIDLGIRKEYGLMAFLGTVLPIPAVIIGIVLPGTLGAPGMYTRTQRGVTALEIAKLTYLNGNFGSTDSVRLDTNAGVFLLDADALVPRVGVVYLITRRHVWGSSTRNFICMQATDSACWPVRAENRMTAVSETNPEAMLKLRGFGQALSTENRPFQSRRRGGTHSQSGEGEIMDFEYFDITVRREHDVFTIH